METQKLFEIIDLLNDSYLKIWEESCNIESPTHYKEGVDKVGEYFSNIAKELGFNVKRIECQKAGNPICITMNPEVDAKPICVSAHLDTVHEVGSFGDTPVHLDEEKIYGPGVADCKGGVVAALLAMEAVSRMGYKARPVKLLLQTDEEVGSRLSDRKTINYIIDEAKDAVAFLNAEGGVPGKLCLARKGIVTFLFKVKGVAAHSCYCANEGANAIIEAAHKMLQLDKIKDADGLTCNCAVISGGTVVNNVPDYCEFKANVRFADEKQYKWMSDYVKKVANTTHVEGCTCEVSEVGFRTAMEMTDRNLELLAKLSEIYEKTGLPTVTAERRNGGSDAADITRAGIPCVDSIGVEGGNIHTLGEFAYIKSLGEAAKRIAAAISYL